MAPTVSFLLDEKFAIPIIDLVFRYFQWETLQMLKVSVAQERSVAN